MDDGVQVVAEVAGKAAECGELAGLHGFDPVRQWLAFELGEHSREVLDVDGGLGHFGAAAQFPFAAEYLLGVEGVGVPGEQVGGLPDGRGVGDKRRSAAGGSKGLHVATDGPGAAQVAAFAEFRVELLGFGAAIIPAFVQVGEIRTDGRVTVPVANGDVFDAGAARVLLDRLVVQLQLFDDGVDTYALVIARMDRGMSFPSLHLTAPHRWGLVVCLSGCLLGRGGWVRFL
ncbi:hypothetical protein ACFYPT_41630 [Streptomyces sp. NPDC005529]|uniref:hypothetical protein n=1 Tax=unclassified Streptomyces TaxID=2593676 RepID=UPI0036C78881